MIKEANNIDFYTIDRQPSEQDFARISEWIKKDKQKQHFCKQTKRKTKQKHLTQHCKRILFNFINKFKLTEHEMPIHCKAVFRYRQYQSSSV